MNQLFTEQELKRISRQEKLLSLLVVILLIAQLVIWF
jgi:hypothetical protein